MLPSGPPVEASVKWFTPEKGFGFVALSDGSGDAFLHVSALERAGMTAASEGARMVVRTGQGQRGPQVTEVISVDESTAGPQPPRREMARPPRRERREPDLASATEHHGTVKWYNRDKGFGFIALTGGGKDVFVHATALARSGLSELAEGAHVVVQVVQGERGPEAGSLAVED
jgi:CspA family cold shock protein